ncbi:MAG TPA: hypothetical protein VFZ61_30645, partial [Polyangiales bacterium]
ASELTQLDEEARADGEALLRFWVEHRRKVIILLARAHGSIHAGFSEQFVDALMRPSLAKLGQDAGKPLSPAVKLLLTNVFRNTVRVIVAILESYTEEADIRHTFQGFWSYQLAGLAGLTEWVNHA